MKIGACFEKFIQEIPKLNPLGSEYVKFWREQKRRCIEGYWLDGYYLPAVGYFYINFWTIRKQIKGGKAEVKGRPNLRDIEWIKSYIWLEAKGFSGFELDEEYHCNKSYMESKDPQGRTYLSPREYIANRCQNGVKDYGKALFQNSCKNVCEIGGRGYGKSYFTSAIAGHNFLFDGATDYEDYMRRKREGLDELSSETLVAAIDSAYSTPLVSKIMLGLNDLPGSQEFNNVTYPSPLAKGTVGTLTRIGSTMESVSKVKKSGNWSREGSGSKIHHRSFGDNPLAANGTRPNLVLLEEVGFMNNLIPALGSLTDCTTVGGSKFGIIWMFGTGGDMDGGSTEAVKEVFYEPESFDCLYFDDEYEAKGKIGLFFPAYYKFDKYRDTKGNINKDLGIDELIKTRERLSKASDKEPLNRELQNNPIKPSEAFLVTTGNVFPVAELKNHLNWLESSIITNKEYEGTKGELVLTSNDKVEFKPDLDNRLRPCKYPLKDTDDKAGCIVIWEHPKHETPYGLYLAGTDPYDQDQAASSPSLGSTFILKRSSVGLSTYDQIVAEYTGRPSTVEEHHENIRKLLLYYNARDLYENERNSLKMHFLHKKSLHLLMSEPSVLKATANTEVSRKYGIHMTKGIKTELELYARDWLITPVEGDKFNLHFIYSIPLLKELIAYNETGNFDRVIAFMLAICARLQFTEIQTKERKGKIIDDFFNRKFWTNENNNSLFI